MQIRQPNSNISPACAWPQALAQHGTTGGTLRVLIADDEAFARAALQMLLKNEAGFEVVGSAANGLEALEAIRALNPDVLFLDIDMPGLNGFEVLERAGRRREMAVVFTTSDEKIGARAYDFAALDYLLKPYSRARFRLALDRARERFETRAQICVRTNFGN